MGSPWIGYRDGFCEAKMAGVTNSHETLTSFRSVERSSSRKFGVTVGGILCFLAVWPLVRHQQPIRFWLFVIGACLVVLGLAIPRALDPLNRLWFKLGFLLARITNPIVMGAMFFLAVVPVGWLIRRRGHDLLGLRRRPDSDSYWIARGDSPPAPLTKQY